MATWPPGLPNGWLVGSPLNIRTGVRRAQMLSGHVRQRVEVTLPFDRFEAKMEFSDAEFRVFEYFIRDVVGDAWYTGPYHDGGGAQTGTLRVANGEYQAQQKQNGTWEVKATIDIDGRK